ncbi:hypothetical protein HPP92_007066 [Vanilla planifolia]|uniref:Uncharacterized protein n=1 Tax=Vanilla planifolia TaxID=51239 RepID=A0A835RQ51_VANPL|nr:hypothetical protein HPP92_007066 [Vanilla planifolia]
MFSMNLDRDRRGESLKGFLQKLHTDERIVDDEEDEDKRSDIIGKVDVDCTSRENNGQRYH